MTPKKIPLAEYPDWGDWMPQEQAAACIGVSPGKFREIALRESVPAYYSGSTILYSRKALNEALERRAKKPGEGRGL